MRERQMEKGKRAKREEENQEVRANLPVELLGEIGKRVGSRVGVTWFRSVCKLWRSSLPRPSLFPLRVPPPPGTSSEEDDAFYLITQVETYRIVFNGRLVSFEEKPYEPGKFRSSNWPPYGSSVFDFSLQKSPLHLVCRTYLIYPGVPHYKPSQWGINLLVRKIILISSNNATAGGVDSNYASLEDLSLVALVKGGKLALLRLAHSDWVTNFCSPSLYFVSIADYQGQLCALAIDGSPKVFLMDYHSLQMTQVENSFFRLEPQQRLLPT